MTTQNYASLSLRICNKDILITFEHDREQKVDENDLSEISQKILFWAKWEMV